MGDYLTGTVHLSWLEDCAYRRLMDVYYSRELPIPADISKACRLVRAVSKDERAAVQVVLEEFFCLTDEGWSHSRCDAEIEKGRVLKDRAKSNGMKGGRKPKQNPDGTQRVISGLAKQNPDGTQKEPDPEAPNPNPNPNPSINTGIHGGTDQKNSVCVPPHTQISDEFRTAIRSRPELDVDLVFANFVDHYPSEKRTLAKWKQWVKNERGPVPNGEGAPSVNDPDSRASIETLGLSVGIGKWDQLKEPWAAYKTRVLAYREAA